MYAQSYQCPNCGAPVPFPSAIAVFAVCGHCRSSVVRRDAQVDLLGQQAQLPPDISPLQVGTTGTFDGRPFTLIGRVRVGYPEGSWNEWCADFGGGSWGWVAESMGVYAVSFEVAPPSDLPGVDLLSTPGPEGLRLVNHGLAVGRESMPVGRHVRIAGMGYRVRDRKQTRVIGSEGTLPFVAVPDRAAISADLGGVGTSFANVEYSDEGVRLFLGRLCTFAELGFDGLRPLPGWTAEAVAVPGADALNCPSCGAPMQLRAPGLTVTALCPNCAALLSACDTRLEVVNIEARRQKMVRLVIPVGRRGRLDGVEYECIGMMQRRDAGGYTWQEYLLFNPFAGFRWLVTYDGHWTLVEVLLAPPEVLPSGDGCVHEGRRYRLFSRGQAQVTFVVGEFYWSVRLRERTDVADYVAAPHVLSSEKYPDLAEVTWSHGTYLEPSAVQEAFGLADALRLPLGVYLNQPNPHARKGTALRWLMPSFIAAYLVVGLAGAATRDHQQVGTWQFNMAGSRTNGAFVTEPFVIGGTHSQSLEVAIDSAVSNGWIEADVELVNLDTQAVREVSVESSYYSGNDDGPWVEDERQRSAMLSAVPPGRYRLSVEPQGDPNSAQADFGLTLTRDVMVWSNFWLGLLALTAYPVYRWLREHAFERERWSASDFSPYTPVSEWLESDGGDD